MIPVTSVVRRMWLLLAVMGVALVAGLGIYRLHRVFGVHEQPRAPALLISGLVSWGIVD
ncbi:Membrane protein [Mycobacterium marinum]|nr:membrane protein, MmpS family [Mycobacterium pseudoshottsii]RFZ55075.1 Membrane protein [Mycobacterium marinum]